MACLESFVEFYAMERGCICTVGRTIRQIVRLGALYNAHSNDVAPIMLL